MLLEIVMIISMYSRQGEKYTIYSNNHIYYLKKIAEAKSSCLILSPLEELLNSLSD